MTRFWDRPTRWLAFICGLMLMIGWCAFSAAQMKIDAMWADGDVMRKGVPVLMYHHILPQDEITGLFEDNNVVVSLEQFESDIQTLKKAGYETVNLQQLSGYVRRGETLPEKSVLITFDDGYLSNKLYAMPILQEAGYTAVIFVLTGWMEEQPQEFNAKGLQYLSWQEIKEMGKTFQFASHTDNLHSLSWNGQGKLTTLSEREFLDDLQRSTDKLNHTQYFSYPYGHYNEMARKVLEQHGIDLAFTVNPTSVHAGDDPFTLGRWDMYQYSIEDVLRAS